MKKAPTSRRPCALLATLCLLFLASASSAVPLRLEILGTVSRADGTGVFALGEAVDLRIDLDLILPLVQPYAFDSVSSASGSGTVDGDLLTLTSGALTKWQISDGYSFDLRGGGPSLGSSAFEGIELAPGVFEGADLAAFLALDASDVRELKLRVRTTFENGSSPTRADVSVTSFSVVPEPGTGALLAFGLLGLARRDRCSRDSA